MSAHPHVFHLILALGRRGCGCMVGGVVGVSRHVEACVAEWWWWRVVVCGSGGGGGAAADAAAAGVEHDS